jgi:hypothetical protein
VGTARRRAFAHAYEAVRITVASRHRDGMIIIM